MMTPRVCDIYHGDTVGGSGTALEGFKSAAAAGLWGIIHKSSQGAAYQDKSYAARRQAALDAGLLWGAYHFNDGSSVKTQIDNFFVAAKPDDKTLMCLDFEDNPRSNMSGMMMVDFLHQAEARLGRKLVIYSGNRMKETIGHLPPADRDYVTSHKLWLCQYGSHAVLPPGWSKYFLWQYTGDGVGQEPHYVPGITVPGGKGIDLNVYDGTREQLAASWASDSKAPAAPAGIVRRGEVIATALNLRGEPSASGAIIAVLKNGAALEIIGDSADWLRVNTIDSRSGWVASRYVTIKP